MYSWCAYTFYNCGLIQLSTLYYLTMFSTYRNNLLQSQMDHYLRYSFRSSQISEKQNREPLRNSLLTRSYVHSNDSKSGSSSSKLNYKYQKVNNSFRLVQIDQFQNENQDNRCETEFKNSNAHILLTLNSLNERVQKLQKNIKFDEHKHNFNLHTAIEKILADNKQANVIKMQIMQKKLERAVLDITQLKQKITSFSILPSYLADSQLHIVKKCQMSIENQINVQSSKLRVEMEQKWIKMQYHLSSMNESKQHLGKAEIGVRKQLEKVQIKLQKKIENISKQINKINSEIACQSLQNRKLSQKIQNISSNNHTIAKQSHSKDEKRTKCNLQIIGNLILQFMLKPKEQNQVREILKSNENVVCYGIDTEGYVVDSEGFYLIDNRGYILKLTPTQLKSLHQTKLIQKL